MTRPAKLATVILSMAVAGALAAAGCGRTVQQTAAKPRAVASPAVHRSQPAAAPTTPAAAASGPPHKAQTPAATTAPQEAGGPVAAVHAYFADLSGGRFRAAYALLAPGWRRTHPYAAFRNALPSPSPQLLSAGIRSEANFDATLDVTLRTASGRTLHGTASLVDLAQGPGAGASAFANWRLAQPITAS